MPNFFETAINTPWKLINELFMYALKPFVLIYLSINGVQIGSGSKFYGFPKVFRHGKGTIVIGNNFECRSWWFSNPLGINHPTVLSAWSKGSIIKIGNDVGISGGSIVASKGIEIGDGVLIGANSTIVDSDFHPVNSKNRRYEKVNIGIKSVKIGNNVFIGMNSIILKGSRVHDNSIVGAGEVVRNG